MCHVDDTVTPGSVDMIKWKIRWKDYNKKSKEWKQQISSHMFNLVWDHTADDMRAQLESRPEWTETLAEQNGVELLNSMHTLHHKQDDTKPGTWEIMEQDYQLYLCTQKQNQRQVPEGVPERRGCNQRGWRAGWCYATFYRDRLSRTRHRLH